MRLTQGIMTMSVATIIAWHTFLMRNTTMITYTDISGIAGIIGFLSSFVILSEVFPAAPAQKTTGTVWVVEISQTHTVICIWRSVIATFYHCFNYDRVAADNAFSQNRRFIYIKSDDWHSGRYLGPTHLLVSHILFRQRKIAASISALLVVGSVSATLLSRLD